jgi:hypothetical protein
MLSGRNQDETNDCPCRLLLLGRPTFICQGCVLLSCDEWGGERILYSVYVCYVYVYMRRCVFVFASVLLYGRVWGLKPEAVARAWLRVRVLCACTHVVRTPYLTHAAWALGCEVRICIKDMRF